MRQGNLVRRFKKPWRGVFNSGMLLYGVFLFAALGPVSLAESVSTKPVETLVEEGYRLYDAGQLGEAEKRFLAAIAVKPDSHTANEGLMWVYYGADDYTSALQYADAMRALAPGDIGVLEKWMLVAVSVTKNESMVAATASRLAHSYSDNVEKLTQLAELLASSDSYLTEAADIYRNVVLLDREDIDHRNKLAHILFRAGFLTEAAEQYRQVLESSPEDEIAKQQLAEIALQTGNHVSAIQLFHQQLEQDPNNTDAIIGLAHRARFDGDLITALELLERASEIHPNRHSIRIELNEIKRDAERLKSARYGPTLPLVVAVAVLPVFFGSLLRGISTESYAILAAYSATISLAALGWLFLVPLD